jgi:hypothetical protein
VKEVMTVGYLQGLDVCERKNAPRENVLIQIAEEVIRAREKFPGNRFLLAALVEEVGELAEAIGNKDPISIGVEAVQVCAVAVRIIEEGDATTYDPKGFLMLATEIGMVARTFLQRADWLGALRSLGHWTARVKASGDQTFSGLTDAEAKA